MSEPLFALDIGTRKVTGILAVAGDNCLDILDTCTIEHKSRPMLDGQVQNIAEVAAVVLQVKRELESRSGRKLDQAAVAVAGRNLQTYRCGCSRNFDVPEQVSAGLISQLELEAIDGLHGRLKSSLSSQYCVGYTPVWYEVDGVRLKTPAGHSARSIGVELIVTFLPRVVLDSIFAVMRSAGLKVSGITLEPIAAMQAIIPQDMRHLNIVLVDIGAGTSDIAIAKDGLVHAFGMVPEAGDEITEAISRGLLVDFQTAERIKRTFEPKGPVRFRDIWHREHAVDGARIAELTGPAVRRLAEAVASCALELNAGIPQAVVIVGGGSRVAGLQQELARSFGMSEGSIGIRLPSMIEGLVDRTAALGGPEAVTPVGIAMICAQSRGVRFVSLEVNGKNVFMLDFRQKKDLFGALVLSGCIDEKKLHPRPGMALSASVNGEYRTVKGGLGSPAVLLRNGKPAASLDEPVEDGDRIEVVPAVDGLDARAKVRDLVECAEVPFLFNGKAVCVLPPVSLNGMPARMDADVPDRARIDAPGLTLRSALVQLGVSVQELSQRQVLVTVNDAPRVLTQRNFTLTVDGEDADLDAPVIAHSRVDFCRQTPTAYRIKDIVSVGRQERLVTISVNGEPLVAPVKTVQVTMNGQEVSCEEFIIDRADIRVQPLEQRCLQLSDIFNYIPFDARQGAGKRLCILVDGQPAGFTTAVRDGASVRVFFQQR